MVWAVVALLAGLLWFSHKLTKTNSSPQSVFLWVWLVSLIAYALLQDEFRAVSLETLAIYGVGAVSFCLGSSYVLLFLKSKRWSASPILDMPRHRHITRNSLDVLLILLLLLLPAYFAWAASQVQYSGDDFLFQQRVLSVERTESSVRTFEIFPNLVVLSTFLPLILFVEVDATFRRRAMFALSVLVALIYGSSTGSKGTGIVLFSSIAFMYLTRTKKPRIWVLAASALGALILFGLGWFAINFTFEEAEAFSDAVQRVTWVILIYWLGGLVAFDSVVQDPSSVPSVQFIWRFFLETANGFGAGFDIPSLHAAYTPIGDGYVTNVYTVYFSYYPDFGFVGVALGLAFYGAVATFLYVRARAGHPIFLALYGAVAGGLVLSIHSERLFLALNGLIKLFIVMVVLYYVVPLLVSARRPRVSSA